VGAIKAFPGRFVDGRSVNILKVKSTKVIGWQ
jgi:hypothetical protein